MTNDKGAMRYAIAVLTALLLILTAVPARAIVYVSTDFPTLVADARAIVVGRVVALESRWNDGRHGIETLVTLEVEQYLKGDLGTSVTVRTPGGQIGPYLSVMPGAPRFAEGDEVALFLAGNGPALPHVLGLGQGVFRIVVDGAGRRVVVPEMLSASSQVATPVVRGDLMRRPAPLDRFVAEVKTLVARRLTR
jgi:hypothetical protein